MTIKKATNLTRGQQFKTSSDSLSKDEGVTKELNESTDSSESKPTSASYRNQLDWFVLRVASNKEFTIKSI